MVYPWIPRFCGFTAFTAVLPKLYWDIESDEQRTKELFKQFHKLVCFVEYIGEKVNIDHENIEELQRLFNEFITSGFDDYYAEQVKRWIDEHLQYIYETTIQQVFFTLDDSGYLLAHVPVGWNQITFSTPMDYSDQTSYGRLCLTYDFDADIS